MALMSFNIYLPLYVHLSSMPLLSGDDTIDHYTLVVNAPLPTFSPLVENKLITTPEVVWNRLIDETACYYYGHWPSLKESAAYRVIGQRMYKKYPAIKQEGPLPWVKLSIILK